MDDGAVGAGSGDGGKGQAAEVLAGAAKAFQGIGGGISNTRFGAQRVKDGIVDVFRTRTGRRPSVDIQAPDIRINAHLAKGDLTLSLDLSGESLHRRGYRTSSVTAPLKALYVQGFISG